MADKTEALDQQPDPQPQQGSTASLESQEPTSPPPYESCPCLRCGYAWKARDPNKRPSSCPQCGSALWDKPPQRRNARRPNDPPNPNWKYRLKPIKRKCPTCKRPWVRLTVKERQKLEEERRDQIAREAETQRIGREVVAEGAIRPTPPPSLRRPTPPPMRPRSADNPETVASRRSLSEELKEESK